MTKQTKRDLALAYIGTAIDSTCKAMVRLLHCPSQVWKALKVTFQSVSKAAIDAKLASCRTSSWQKLRVLLSTQTQSAVG